MDCNLVGSVCEQFDVDLDTLHAHRLQCQTDLNKKKHLHCKPPKDPSLLVTEPRHMHADKAELNLNGSKYAAKKANTAPHPADVTIKGITCSVSMMYINLIINTTDTPKLTTYHVSASRHSNKTGALADCSASGGIAGADCCVIEHMDQFVNVEGIDNHVMEQHLLVTARGVTNSYSGPIILIMHQYALADKGTSIHSLPQMEWYQINVDDRSVKVGELQRLTSYAGWFCHSPGYVTWPTISQQC